MTYRSAEPALRCPRCGDVPLGPLEASPGVTVDFCGSCKGLWCDEGELATLLGARDDHPLLVASRRAGSTSIRHCPACPDTFLRTCRLEFAGELQLLDLHGWTAGGLIRAYVGVGDACLAVVAVHYGVFLRRALAKARAAAGA